MTAAREALARVNPDPLCRGLTQRVIEVGVGERERIGSPLKIEGLDEVSTVVSPLGEHANRASTRGREQTEGQAGGGNGVVKKADDMAMPAGREIDEEREHAPGAEVSEGAADLGVGRHAEGAAAVFEGPVERGVFRWGGERVHGVPRPREPGGAELPVAKVEGQDEAWAWAWGIEHGPRARHHDHVSPFEESTAHHQLSGSTPELGEVVRHDRRAEAASEKLPLCHSTAAPREEKRQPPEARPERTSGRNGQHLQQRGEDLEEHARQPVSKRSGPSPKRAHTRPSSAPGLKSNARRAASMARTSAARSRKASKESWVAESDSARGGSGWTSA